MDGVGESDVNKHGHARDGRNPCSGKGWKKTKRWIHGKVKDGDNCTFYRFSLYGKTSLGYRTLVWGSLNIKQSTVGQETSARPKDRWPCIPVRHSRKRKCTKSNKICETHYRFTAKMISVALGWFVSSQHQQPWMDEKVRIKENEGFEGGREQHYIQSSHNHFLTSFFNGIYACACLLVKFWAIFPI